MEGQQGWQRAERATKTRKQRVTIDIDSQEEMRKRDDCVTETLTGAETGETLIR
jgi:hypothetical protein